VTSFSTKIFFIPFMVIIGCTSPKTSSLDAGSYSFCVEPTINLTKYDLDQFKLDFEHRQTKLLEDLKNRSISTDQKGIYDFRAIYTQDKPAERLPNDFGTGFILDAENNLESIVVEAAFRNYSDVKYYNSDVLLNQIQNIGSNLDTFKTTGHIEDVEPILVMSNFGVPPPRSILYIDHKDIINEQTITTMDKLLGVREYRNIEANADGWNDIIATPNGKSVYNLIDEWNLRLLSQAATDNEDTVEIVRLKNISLEKIDDNFFPHTFSFAVDSIQIQIK